MCNAIVQALEPRMLLAATSINDFNPGQSVIGGVTIGGVTYYNAYHGTPNTMYQLMRSDGTPSGTYPISEPSDNVDGLQPIDLFNFNGTLYFEALVASSGEGLYTSDGTSAGTTLVLTFSEAVNPSFTQVGNELYFFGTDSSSDLNLYKTDGTSAGPTLVQTLETNVPSDGERVTPSMANLNGTLYFTAPDLWKLDANGKPELVKSFGDQNQAGGDLIAVNNTLYFKAQDPSNPYQLDLWESDGTTAGTSVLWTDGISNLSGGGDVYAFNNDLYFITDSSASGYQLYRSDGTVSGTTLLTSPGFTFDQQIGFTVADGKLFFAASGPSTPSTIWTSDGTANGTMPVVDPSIGVTSMLPGSNVLYFIASNGDLYDTNGSSTALADPSESADGWAANRLLGQAADGLLFAATDSSGSETTYVLPAPATLPPPAPPVAVPPAVASPAMTVSYGAPVELQAVNNDSETVDSAFQRGVSISGVVYYSVDDGVHGSQVWKTDGTAAGTSMVSDINASGGGCQPYDLTEFNGTLYFIAIVATGTFGIGQDLYKTDGTLAGTTLVAANVQPTAPIQIGNELYFLAYDSSSNLTNLYKTDGTAAGTVSIPGVFDFTGASGSMPMVGMGVNLYIESGDDILQVTPADQTQVVATLPTGIDIEDPSQFELFATDNAIYFTDGYRDGNSEGLALYTNDGTPGSTSAVLSSGIPGEFEVSAVALGDDLIFTTPTSLYRTDGTIAGTFAIGGDAADLTVAGSNVYFTQNSYYFGTETYGQLWVTDGTVGGTRLVSALASAGSTPISPWGTLAANNSLYFVGSNSDFYQTNGTATAWIDPLVSSSTSESGDTIGLSANGLVYSAGNQLWVLSAQAAVPPGTTTPTLPPTPPPSVSSSQTIPPTPPSAFIPTLENVSLASQVVAGSKLDATVPVIVTNTGKTLRGKMTVKLFVENGSTLDGTQVLLGTKARRVALKAGQTTAFAFDLKSLPAILQGGAYHLIAEVIDPSGDTNTVATVQAVEVATRIVQASASANLVSSTKLTPGKFGTVIVDVSNTGNAAPSGGKITLNLSTDPTSPFSGVTLKTVTAGMAVPGGDTREFLLRFKVPADTSPTTNCFLYALVSFTGWSGTAIGTVDVAIS